MTSRKLTKEFWLVKWRVPEDTDRSIFVRPSGWGFVPPFINLKVKKIL